MEEQYGEWELMDTEQCPSCRSEEIFSREIRFTDGYEAIQYECDACGTGWEEDN